MYRRALECFTRLESTYYGEDVILVSHQDTLSLFTASLMGTKLTDHHVDWPLELGEVRCVDLSAAPSFGAGELLANRPARRVRRRGQSRKLHVKGTVGVYYVWSVSACSILSCVYLRFT